jgi:hypothetical protein
VAQHRTIPSAPRRDDADAFDAHATRHQTLPHQPTASTVEVCDIDTFTDACSSPSVGDAPAWSLLGEILDIDPARLNQRTLGEWRSLHEKFFTRLLDFTSLAGIERQTLESVLEVVNKQTPPLFHKPLDEAQYQAWIAGKREELAAMGLNEFPPITIKELGELATGYSPRIDYSEAIDITNLPAKALLFFAALYARVYAGLRADQRTDRLSEERPALHTASRVPESLRTRNRNESFACFPFFEKEDYSVVEFRRAGLQPVFSSEQLSYLFTRNSIRRIEYQPESSELDPPHLRVFFQDPVVEPITGYSSGFLDVILLTKPLPAAPVSDDMDQEIAFLESDQEAVHQLAFDERDPGEHRIGILLKLLWLTSAQRAVVGLFWATAPQAARLGSVMGRTQEERFAIERFFALGFRTASANQPWLRRDTRYHFKDRVNGLKQWYEAFKRRVEFFQQFGLIEASLVSDAEVRKEILMADGSVRRGFQLLNGSEPFRPLAQLFLRPDAKGNWVIDSLEVGSMVKCVDTSFSMILSSGLSAIEQTLNSFGTDRQWAVTLWFELSVGIMEALARLPGVRFSKIEMRGVVAALRQGYQEVFALEIQQAPSWNHLNGAARMEIRQELDRKKRLIWDLAMQPIGQLAGPLLEEQLKLLTRLQMDHPLVSKPLVLLSSATEFQWSVHALARWLKEIAVPLEARSLDLDLGQDLAGAVAFRKLAEEGQLEAARAKAQELLPRLSRKKRAEFEQCLGGLQMAKVQNKPAQTVTQMPAKESVPARTAAELLKAHADELSLPPHALVREFLVFLREDRGDEFRKKKQLRAQLDHLTRFGGREPFRSSLKLLKEFTNHSSEWRPMSR